MRPKTKRKIGMTFVGWFVALLVVFPIFWMTLAAFKTEIAAVSTPPQLFFTPTLENFAEVRSRADYPVFALEQHHHLGQRDPGRDRPRSPGGLRDGVPPVEAHQGPPAVDAVDQDDAGDRRADPDLSWPSKTCTCSTRSPV